MNACKLFSIPALLIVAASLAAQVDVSGFVAPSGSSYDFSAASLVKIPAFTWVGVAGGVGYQNGFADNGGSAQVGQYGIDIEGNVWLRGFITGASSTGTVIFTLPSGFRPKATNVFVVYINVGTNEATRIDIHTDGTVNLSGTTTAQLSLNQIVFSVN